jgi:hypothetical protein
MIVPDAYPISSASWTRRRGLIRSREVQTGKRKSRARSKALLMCRKAETASVV